MSVRKRNTASEQRALRVAEFTRQRELEEQRQRLAVIAEFGGKRKERPLVPEDDPANNPVLLRLADEVLLLRGQLRCVGRAIELAQAGELAAVVRRGPGRSSEAPIDGEEPADLPAN
jgi:hypothetical protein